MTKKDREAIAHEIWSAAQLLPNEGIEDGIYRVVGLLEKLEGPQDGFVLVPVEPSFEMYKAALESYVPGPDAPTVPICDIVDWQPNMQARIMRTIYKAMLDARPDNKGE